MILVIVECCYIMEKGKIMWLFVGSEVNEDNVWE